jgi:hypothetical protein
MATDEMRAGRASFIAAMSVLYRGSASSSRVLRYRALSRASFDSSVTCVVVVVVVPAVEVEVVVVLGW